MTEQKDTTRYVYIYNPQQASYYLSQGMTLVDTGVHPKTKHIWYKFYFEQTVDVYGKWCTRNK